MSREEKKLILTGLNYEIRETLFMDVKNHQGRF